MTIPRYVVHAGATPERSLLGGKAAPLVDMSRFGADVPAWFVVTTAAFDASLEADDRARLAAGDLSVLDRISIPGPVADEIEQAVRTLSPDGCLLALRSSAADEDSGAHSFAGQFDTFLNVEPGDVTDRLPDLWRSGFSERILAYRRENGLGATIPPAALIQRMVVPDRAGVVFSANPLSGRTDQCVINVVAGLADRLVAGEIEGQTYIVGSDGELVEQPAADGLLSPDDVRRIADLARHSAAHFGVPQDLEWAIEKGRLYALQSRPITTLSVGGTSRILWDNSNIVESYSGVTTPLTFSFARHVYEGVYRQLALVLGVSRRAIDREQNTFRNMLGLHRGRVYYNILNWYRALSLLPGFALNRRFMEQMMGVDEELPQALVAEIAGSKSDGGLSKWLGVFPLAATLFGVVVKWIGLGRSIKAFSRRIDHALDQNGEVIERLAYDDLAADFRRLERDLLSAWMPPLVNDLWCMIGFGAARKLMMRWAGDDAISLLNDLLSEQGGIISTEPARQLARMGQLAKGRPDLIAALTTGTIEDVAREASKVTEFAPALDRYIAQFGDRCAGELKLETPTLRDDPLPLYRAIAAAADRDGAAPDRSAAQDAMQELTRRLEGKPVKRRILFMALAEAKARVRDRENMRFERTRVFGRVRRLFRAMGVRLVEAGRLRSADDVFYLTTDELLGAAEGTAAGTAFQDLADARRREFDAYRLGPAPPRRFETVGAAALSALFETTRRPAADGDPNERAGIGCCPGLVKGRARVVRDPSAAALEKGDILVAEFTDPGWIMLFANASGIVVERGSLLSHSAIVAREMRIPAVVAVPGVMDWVTDGEMIEIDGAAGRVRKTSADDKEEAA